MPVVMENRRWDRVWLLDGSNLRVTAGLLRSLVLGGIAALAPRPASFLGPAVVEKYVSRGLLVGAVVVHAACGRGGGLIMWCAVNCLHCEQGEEIPVPVVVVHQVEQHCSAPNSKHYSWPPGCVWSTACTMNGGEEILIPVVAVLQVEQRHRSAPNSKCYSWPPGCVVNCLHTVNGGKKYPYL
jgi:hypothetical protein